MPKPPENLNQFSSLVQLIADLRGPEGCPWDKEQTHKSLTPYAIEETYEMVEAIEHGSDSDVCEELGDVLFQVVLHAELARERGAFQIEDVIKSINEKLVRRHPHVFSGLEVSGTDEIIKNWDIIKAQEKALKGQTPEKKKKAFNIPPGVPALQVAHKIGEKTEQYKFDWKNLADVLRHLKSEIAELEQAMQETSSPASSEHIRHEMGDILFCAAQLARHLKSEPETLLRQANTRFKDRFAAMLGFCNEDLTKFTALSSDEKEELWKKAKLLLG